MRITQIIGTMSIFHLEEYKLWRKERRLYSGSEKKIHQCEVFLYVVLVEWMHLTDLHSVVLLAKLGLVVSMLITQKFTKS